MSTVAALGMPCVNRQPWVNQAPTGIENEACFRALFCAAPIPVALHGNDGRLLQTNRAYQELLHYTDAELRSAGVKGITHPDDVPEARRLFQEIQEGRRDSYQRFKRLLTKDGTMLWTQSTVSAVRDGAGKLRFVLSMVQDISAQVKADQRRQTFYQISHRLSAVATPREAGALIVQIADELLGWDACFLHLYDPRGQILGVLTIDTVEGQRVEFPPTSFTPEPSPMMDRVKTEGPKLILREVQEGAAELVPFGEKGRRSASLMFVPIHNGAEVVGVLSIQSYKPRAYGQADLDALQVLADHCGGALARIAAAEFLSQRERRHSVLLEGLPDWMFRITAAGVVLDSKSGCMEEIPLAFDDAKGRTLGELWPEPLVGRVLECVGQAIAEGVPQRFEFEHASPKGGHSFEARVVRCGPDEAMVILRDLTPQRRLEQRVAGASAREQQRIGKDLHDDLGQILTGVGYRAQALRQRLARASPAAARDAADISGLVAQALGRTRLLVRGLLPVGVGARGDLLPALEEMGRNAGRLFNITCTLRSTVPLKFRRRMMADHVYRLVQESVSNAVRHGHATRVEIEFAVTDGRLILTVRDDGVGLGRTQPTEPGLGRQIMQCRARCVGGEFQIERHPFGGTVVTCAMPAAVLKKGEVNRGGPEGEKRGETKSENLPH